MTDLQKTSPTPTAWPSPAAFSSLGQQATLAITWGALAPKVGNVYRGADFENLTLADFLTAATRIGPILAHALTNGVGQTVLDGVITTHHAVATNTNLGTLLLFAPLAAAMAKPQPHKLQKNLATLLATLTPTDTRLVYQAIRLTGTDSLDSVPAADISDPPPSDLNLLEAMKLAENYDLIARQYSNGFQQIFTEVVPALLLALQNNLTLADAIVHTQIQLLATYPDSLIARKCGAQTAQEASDRAAEVLATGSPGEAAYATELTNFDFWLRSDKHRRNPGTTADMIAAGLFILLFQEKIPWPVRFYKSNN